MRSHDLYSAFAVALPVSLGLGLIYLYALDRIGAITAIATVVAVGAIMIVAAAMADMGREEERRRHRRGLPADRA